MITGGVKTTPVLAMQLLCDLQPFTNIIEKNAAILFNRLIRLPNNSFWRDYDSDGGRNLKTQKGFIQCVRENIQYKVINDVPFELLSFANPLDYAILDIRLDLVLNVKKRDLSPTALHAIALETINTRFPPEEWLHIYTDGSLLDFAQGAGIGVFCHLFSFYLHVGPLTTHFDGEIEAIHIALQQLAVRLPPIERAEILSDSTSAFQALSNYNENNCLRVQNCRELLGKIKGKIVFQWNFRRDLTLHSAKLEIKRIFRESFRLTASLVARDKPWNTLCKKSHGIPSSPRAAAVAKFRLLTGHDCLCAHLFRFNLVTSPICILCDTGQDMTAAHLDECSALNDLNCIVKRCAYANNGDMQTITQVDAVVNAYMRQQARSPTTSYLDSSDFESRRDYGRLSKFKIANKLTLCLPPFHNITLNISFAFIPHYDKGDTDPYHRGNGKKKDKKIEEEREEISRHGKPNAILQRKDWNHKSCIHSEFEVLE
ncbi:uncharacterized protein LOC103524116 [Trichonephila clavipes]|uniref:Uncharacterized protein LOC103524116 n=1 Tax=Trichonephila clavipes TaxID=2585209 RepID=A0A8X6VUX5_TRICX|nr:uncharacterized protein LOC103524116 [Trichonephila clavipes]